MSISLFLRNFGSMIPFHPLHTDIERPDQFNDPFSYEPHPLSILAAEEVQRYIIEYPEIKADADKGKMFGVLVVSLPRKEEGERKKEITSEIQDEGSGIGFLAAYSGLLAGRNDWGWFVPPVFDAQHPDGYFKVHEREITEMNHEVEVLEKQLDDLHHHPDYLKMLQSTENLLNDHERKMKGAKVLRDMKRLQRNLSPEENAALVRESQFMKAEMRRIKKRCEELEQPWKGQETRINKEIERLRGKRKEASDDLQRWLFTQYKMLNAVGETKDLIEIFHDHNGQLPPAGSGDCCAPKLLQYAYQHGLKPLCMAEFWWGRSPKMEIRHHLNYYPACRGKCLPILGWMLLRRKDEVGRTKEITSEIQDSNDSAQDSYTQNISPSSLLLPPSSNNIIFEDSHLLVLNKPAGMLSVSGKTGAESVESMMRDYLHDEVNPLIVHRLDMDTSGLMVVAKTKWAHEVLQKEFLDHQVQKTYVAKLEHMPEGKPLKGVISLPLRPDLYDRPRQLVDHVYGKEAVTEYEITGEEATIVLRPLTGRTHQLRVHCAHQEGLGVPILGDPLYGHPADRLYLHAETLTFIHPKTGERLTFTEPLMW